MTLNNTSSPSFVSSVDRSDDIVVEDAAVPANSVNTGQDNGRSSQPSNNRRRQRRLQVGGAAAAGGLAGLVLMGPVTAVVAAGGAAVLATTKGNAGDVARATGEVTAKAGRSIKKFDEKHKVVEKTSKGVVKGCNWVSKKLQK